MLSSVQSVIAPSPSLSSAVHSSMIQEHSSYDTFSTLLPMPFLHPSLLALLEKEASPYAQATNFQFTSQSASTITANEFRDSVVRTIADMDLRRPVLQLIGDKDRESSPSILVSSSTSDRSSISPSGPPTVIARLEGGGAFVNPGSRTKKKEDEIAAKAESLERENFQLRMQVENLRAETDQLRGLVLAASPRSHALPRPSLSILTSPVSTTHSSTFSSSSSVSSTTMQLMLPCEKASTKYHSPVQEIRAPVPIRPMPNMPNSSSVIARNSVLVANIIG